MAVTRGLWPALLFGVSLAAQDLDVRKQAIPKIDAETRAVMSKAGIPGMTVAVRWPDGREWSKGFGVADVENQVPATDRTVYRLASISKPITAVAVLQLVERGQLDLDQPVSSLVEEWEQKRWPVTSRQLLGHIAGVRHYQGRMIEVYSNTHYDDITTPLEIFADDRLLFEPGTSRQYSTYGFNLLGAVVVAKSGLTFGDYLTKNVFEPVLAHDLQIDDPWKIVPHRAQGYRRVRGELRNSVPVDVTNKVPGGGLCGTALDLVRFAGGVLEGKLLKPETREMMWTEMRASDGKATTYGMGWSVMSRDGARYAAHGGAQPRVSTYLLCDTERGHAVALMCNLEGQGAVLRRLAWTLATFARGG